MDPNSLALHSFALEETAKQSKAMAAGVENVAPTDTQRYLRDKLIGLDDRWGQVEPHGLRVLNRKYGHRATTEALQRMVEETISGLEPRNPFALLWAVAEGRAG